ncbi:MAG: LysR family transcriptional regulator [Chitinophagia bacterium]|nr:LysR family transcriptional regulator [Chitinophagia bacterium]
MNYTLNQLKIFLKVTQTGSITKAAEELHLTQPAVSIQLRNFQEQFEIPLTELVGRQLYVTDFGREIAEVAETILEGVNTLSYKTLAHKGQLTGKLRISIVSTGTYVFPYFLTDFLQMHPGVELILDVTNRLKVIESLERNEVDFSLLSVLPDNLSLEHISLMQNKLYLVVPTDTQEPTDTGIHALERHTLIYRERGSATRLAMERFINERQIPVLKKIELTSNEAVKQAIIAGLGASIMPLIGLKNELNNGELTVLPVPGLPLTSYWHLVWLKNKKLSFAASAYLRYLQQEKANIIHRHFNWVEHYEAGSIAS